MSGWPGALAHVSRQVVRLGRDRLAHRAPIPRHVGDIDAALLSDLLGAEVASVDRLGGSEGTTDRVRLRLSGDGVPDSVFVKMAPTALGARAFGNVARLGLSEVGFYRDVRPDLDIEAPTALALELDDATGRYILVLEDLIASGCTFTDTRATLPLARVEAAIDALAAVHGRYWSAPRASRPVAAPIPPWVRANSGDPLLPLVAAVLPLVARRLAKVDPGLVPRHGRALLRHYRSVARVLDEGPSTLLHGDPHPGNLYLRDDRVGLLDWQVVRRGNGLRDVAYLLVLGLDETTRADHERGLLDRYRFALADAGGPLQPESRTWQVYRQMAAYPYVAAVITAGLGGLQADDIADAGLRRAVLAIDELETAQVLGVTTGGP